MDLLLAIGPYAVPCTLLLGAYDRVNSESGERGSESRECVNKFRGCSTYYQVKVRYFTTKSSKIHQPYYFRVYEIITCCERYLHT